MNFNKKLSVAIISASVLFNPLVMNESSLTSKPQSVKATTISKGQITLVKKFNTPLVYDKDGKLLDHQPQNIDFSKSFKYYSKPVVLDGAKIYSESYINGMPQIIINGKEYLDLGDGGYILAKNVGTYSWTNGIFTLSKASYVYNEKGKKLSTYRGKKAYYPAHSSIKHDGQLYTYRPNSYVNIGNDQYISTDDIDTIDGKGVLKLKVKTAVYNKNGKRTSYNGKKFLAKYDLVNYSGSKKSATKKDDYYYYDGNKKYSIPITKIHGQDYYSLGGNAYVKVINVDSINGHALLRNGGSTVVIPRGDIFIYNHNFKKTNKFIKQGKKIKVDKTEVTGKGDSAQRWFKIAGTKGSKAEWLLWGDDSEYGYGNDTFAGNLFVRTRIED
ncbi:SLAP domain-containing protein [Lactobacillus sp. PSON]|uniref:SLAP domain-containing protein n=1 Tax=Lactobacillus sp. PSON TaxID=3455454 RepID=UPI004041A629